jgi:general secretion pathway protein G
MKKGFTLIELLVVISIIGILVAAGVTSYQRASKLSRDARRKTDLEQLRQALETFRSENGSYPTAAQGGLGALDPDYITTVPSDPRDGVYTYTPSGNPPVTYTLCASLELIETPATCNYTVTQP